MHPRSLSDKDLARLAAHIDATGTAKGFVPTPRKKRSNEESQMQRALIKWWRMACRGFGVPELCLFSVPNGGGGGEMRGHWLKLEGCRKGVPDLFLAAPKEGATEGGWRVEYAGLFLELKTKTGRLSPEQEVYHEVLRKQGYRVEVCRSLEECVKTISEYLT